MRLREWTGAVLMLVFMTTSIFAQESSTQESASTAFLFGTDLAFGVISFVDQESGESLTYQQIALRPAIEVGRFGLGLDLALNYRFTGGEGNEFDMRHEDWAPSGEMNFLELYLPKIQYIRYGRKADPLHAQFGTLRDVTMGNGFILEDYTNALFRPERSIFGGILDVDGKLVGGPQVGIETMVANVAAWDLMAARFHTRPMASLSLPVLPRLQIGSTIAVDRDPYYHIRKNGTPNYEASFDDIDTSRPDSPVLIWGLDTRLPLATSNLLNLAVLGDIVWQEERMGGMVGVGGSAWSFLLYGAQLRLYGDNFVPTYFDMAYDRRRVERYMIYQKEVDADGAVGWLGRLGLSLLGDRLIFLTTVSGPFVSDTTVHPELKSSLSLAEGTIPGFAGLSFDATYEKWHLQEMEDLIRAENALIGARFNIRSGPVIITLSYNLMYDPLAEGDPWVITSGLETAISF